MVSMTELSALHDSDETAARVKSRHAAEFRLKAYGILAIAISGLALIALLWTVVGNALRATTEHYVTLNAPLAEAGIDPEAIGKANFSGIAKDMLKERFPEVRDRKLRRQLYDMISVGAPFELRQAALADPKMIEGTPAFDFLASDVLDLYLKGEFGTLDEQGTSGKLSLTPDAKGKTVEIFSTANDFSDALRVVKDELMDDVRRLRRQVALEENGIAFYEEALAEAGDDAARATAEAQLKARRAGRDAKLAEIDALIARSQAGDTPEKLGRGNPSILLHIAGGWIKMTELNPTGGKGKILSPIDGSAEYGTGEWSYMINEAPEISRKISDHQIVWAEELRAAGAIKSVANWRFLSGGDSRDPELAGLWGAIVGSFWTMLVTFALAFPIGVLAAIYLEEFAPKNKITDFIEVNINNLAAVPSIIFGLLGLAIFLGVFGVPRSSPLAGGIVLALMTLPTIIIAARASIRAVPPSIRDAALGLGASQLQTSFHHVLPLAMPGILTGTIIGMAQALGETAPLIMIGMVAFIVDIPGGIFDSATALPVQVFRWADFPERAFEAKTGAAICVLLFFLIVMNALAVFLRKQFERRW